MKRIYHNYKKWEDYKLGFYNIPLTREKEEHSIKCKELFEDEKLTNHFMCRVVNEWKFSCEHNLTNLSMNRIAYLGQGACCLYAGIPSLSTMNNWSYLDEYIKKRSDLIAIKNIKKWELKLRSKPLLRIGKGKIMIQEYQMKLPFN